MDHRRTGKEETPRRTATNPAPDTGASTTEAGCTCGACGGNPAVKSHFYTFVPKHFVRVGNTHVYRGMSFTTLAKNADRAFEIAKKRFPEGSDLFCWYLGTTETANWTCNMCSGPWHPALGHIDVGQNRLWCGVCTKDMIKFLKSMLVRTWGGIKFYEHATVPVGDTISS